MQFINIGFGNLVSVQRLIAVVSPDSAPLWTATMWCCPPWRRSVWRRAWDCRWKN